MPAAQGPLLLAVVAASLAGCFGNAPSGDGGLPDMPATLASAALVEYLHDISPRIDGLELLDAIQEHHRIRVEDGAVMDAWTVRPPGDGPFPLVITATPYYGGGPPVDVDADAHFLDRWGSELYLRGYAVGIVNVRGTGSSEGCFTAGHAIEARDTAIVIEELASLPWSNARVGMVGASWPGTTPIDVWSEAPPSLKAILPVAGVPRFYRELAMDGVPFDGYARYAIDFPKTSGLLPTNQEGGSPLNDPVAFVLAQQAEACPEWRALNDAVVGVSIDGKNRPILMERDMVAEAARAVAADPGTPRAAVFMSQGFQDWNVQTDQFADWLDVVVDSGASWKLWLGQWDHYWPQAAGVRTYGLQEPTTGECDTGHACRNDFWNEAYVAWFDQFLLGRDTGILDAPRVQVQDSDGRWRHDGWPLATTNLTWYASDAMLGGVSGDAVHVFHDHHGQRIANDRFDETPESLEGYETPLGADRVLFVSDPLDADLHLAGEVSANVSIRADVDHAAVVLTLAEVAPDGSWHAVTWGARSLQHDDDFTGSRPIAGAWLDVTVRFFPQDYVIHEGNQLALIWAGNSVGIQNKPTTFLDRGPDFAPITDGAVLEVDESGFSLLMPVSVNPVLEDPQPFAAGQ